MFALEREAKPFRRRCRSAVIEIIGVGTCTATVGATKAIQRHRPTSVVSVGFAGALKDGLHVGDVVVAAEIVCEPGLLQPRDPSDRVACRWQLDADRLRSGFAKTSAARVLTTNTLAATVADKRRLAERFNADVVDMESAAVASVCAKLRLPLTCVRAVSDAVDTPLSLRLASLIAGGRVSIFRMLLAILRQPSLLPEMCRLARDTRFAAERLAEALTAGISPAAH